MSIKNILIGRIDQKNYIFAVVLIFAVIFIVRNLIIYFTPTAERLLMGITSLLFVLAFIFIFILSMRRLHDMGKSPWIMVIYFIPILNVLLCLSLLVANSEIRTNRHGIQIPKASSFRNVLFLQYDARLEKPKKSKEDTSIQRRDDIL